MTTPINIIKFKYEAEATLNRHWHILVDNKNLVDMLEQRVTEPVRGHWPDKSKALVNLEDLKKSLNEQGDLQLLVCANCAASEFRSCGDLSLKPFKVTQEDDFISWEVMPPNAGESPGEGPKIQLTFHRPQYTKEVEKVIQKKGN